MIQMVSLVRPGTACLSKLTVIDANPRSSSYAMFFRVSPGTLRLTVICLRYAILRKVLFAPRKLPILKNKDLTFYPYFLAFPIAINQPCKV
jgi:hypothetical protein